MASAVIQLSFCLVIYCVLHSHVTALPADVVAHETRKPVSLEEMLQREPLRAIRAKLGTSRAVNVDEELEIKIFQAASKLSEAYQYALNFYQESMKLKRIYSGNRSMYGAIQSLFEDIEKLLRTHGYTNEQISTLGMDEYQTEISYRIEYRRHRIPDFMNVVPTFMQYMNSPVHLPLLADLNVDMPRIHDDFGLYMSEDVEQVAILRGIDEIQDRVAALVTQNEVLDEVTVLLNTARDMFEEMFFQLNRSRMRIQSAMYIAYEYIAVLTQHPIQRDNLLKQA